MIIDATNKYYKQLNEEIKHTQTHDITVKNVLGQRYIGTGVKDKKMTVYGTPGNAMGAYLDNIDIEVFGNVQDAVGDTMNDGHIVVHGKAGDTLGYAMRGGSIYVKGDAGYRVGIHMKAYQDKQPVIVVGGCVGSFLGEYQAGGTILVLGLGSQDSSPIGNYCGTGMHGGNMYIRSAVKPEFLPPQVSIELCDSKDMAVIQPLIDQFCEYFDIKEDILRDKPYYHIFPNADNPYKSLYTSY
ncbi:GltB/FmdC/FwdC-like GXGXG domain-containing protein [Pseudoramibacter porci]|uniref:Glutamate synthase n=1 Tax=Pseudoramibacter porci TaxID=2606631 RepID=A0A7X2NES9_9FIRM|nr:glutamate synthase [Pseudoramibacter porci]MSS19291.1 glutamate synthase [Pseudoramibacter porci]